MGVATGSVCCRARESARAMASGSLGSGRQAALTAQARSRSTRGVSDGSWRMRRSRGRSWAMRAATGRTRPPGWSGTSAWATAAASRPAARRAPLPPRASTSGSSWAARAAGTCWSHTPAAHSAHHCTCTSPLLQLELTLQHLLDVASLVPVPVRVRVLAVHQSRALASTIEITGTCTSFYIAHAHQSHHNRAVLSRAHLPPTTLRARPACFHWDRQAARGPGPGAGPGHQLEHGARRRPAAAVGARALAIVALVAVGGQTVFVAPAVQLLPQHQPHRAQQRHVQPEDRAAGIRERQPIYRFRTMPSNTLSMLQLPNNQLLRVWFTFILICSSGNGDAHQLTST